MKNLLLLIVAISNLATFAQNPYKRDADGQYIVKIGDELPSFSYTTFDGDTLDSDFLRGRPAIIQFVASWCPYSKLQLWAVEDLIWKKYGDENISVVAFTEDYPSDTANFRQMAKDKGITYQLAFDDDERIFKLFASPKAGVTRLIVVDSNGKIVELEDEFSRKTFKRTRNTIKNLSKTHKGWN